MFIHKIVAFELNSPVDSSRFSNHVIKNLSRLNKGVHVLVSGGIWAASQGISHASPLQPSSSNPTETTPSTLPPHYSEDKTTPVSNIVFAVIMSLVFLFGVMLILYIIVRNKCDKHRVCSRISERMRRARDHMTSMRSYLSRSVAPSPSTRYVNNDTAAVQRQTASVTREPTETVLREDAFQSTPEERPDTSNDRPNPPPLHQILQPTQSTQLTLSIHLPQPVNLPHSLDQSENPSPPNSTSENVKIDNPPSYAEIYDEPPPSYESVSK